MNTSTNYHSRGALSEGWSFNSDRLDDISMHLEDILDVGRRLVEQQQPGLPSCFKSPSTPKRVYKRRQEALPNNLIPQALGVPPPFSPSPMNHHPRVPRTPRELKRRIDRIRRGDKDMIQHALGLPLVSPCPMDIFRASRTTKRRVFEKVNNTMLNLKTIPKTLGCITPRAPERRKISIRNDSDVGDVGRVSEKGQSKTEETIVRGLPASMGIAKGTVRIVLEDDDFQKAKEGDILVMDSCASLSLESVKASYIISQCAGICTDVGGMLCQAAIVGREQAIPTVVGCHSAGKMLHDGDFVMIDGSNATITLLHRGED